MARSLGQLVASFTVVLGLTGALHYYVWARLVRDTALPPPFRQSSLLLLVALATSMPLAFLLARLRPEPVRALSYVAFVWMGVLLLLTCSLASTEAVRGLAWLWHRAGVAPLDGGRRQFFGRLLGGTAAAAAFGLGLRSLRNGLSPPTTVRLQVPLRRLPRALDGMTVVQLTDLHIGPTLGRPWLEDVVRRTNALAPDLVAITGDLVDGSVATLRDAVAPLAWLKARYGVYFVTGNHEYYAGADSWIAELERLGVRVLRNERVAVGAGEHTIDLAGVDDFHAHGILPGHGADLPQALAGRDPARECLLLAHQPKAVHEAARLGVGLQLSGHTHGGQIWPWRYAVLLQQPYIAGLVKEAETWLYVSKGTGYWGPPMRLGADAEITHLTLRALG